MKKLLIVFFVLLILLLSSCVEKKPQQVNLPITKAQDAIAYSENITEVKDYTQKNPDATAVAKQEGDIWIVAWKKSKVGVPETLYVYIEAKTGNVTNTERIY